MGGKGSQLIGKMSSHFLLVSKINKNWEESNPSPQITNKNIYSAAKCPAQNANLPRSLVSPWARGPTRSLQALHAIQMAMEEGAGGGRGRQGVGEGDIQGRPVEGRYPPSLGHRLGFNGGAEKQALKLGLRPPPFPRQV